MSFNHYSSLTPEIGTAPAKSAFIAVSAAGIPMTKADNFRRQALICDQQAAESIDQDDRARFEWLARRWRELAAEAEALDSVLLEGIVWSSSRGAEGSEGSNSIA
jgi:hypothetical protein